MTQQESYFSEKAPQARCLFLYFPQGVGFEPTRAFAQTVFKMLSATGRWWILTDDDGSLQKMEEAEK